MEPTKEIQATTQPTPQSNIKTELYSTGKAFLGMFTDQTGKASWGRITASVVLAYVLFAGTFGFTIPKEILSGLFDLLKFLAGAITGATVGIAIGKGMAAKTAKILTDPPKPTPGIATTTIPAVKKDEK